MKKVFVYAMGLAALLAVSCNNKDNSANPEAPATQEWAQLIKFSEPVQIGAYAFQSVELTESSRYIAEYVTSKASAGANILYGKYTYANGTFTLDGLGSLKIDGNQVTINPSSAGGSPVQVPATITRPSAKDQTAVNACRNWSISKIIIGISGKTKDGNTVEGDKMFNKLDVRVVFLQNIVTDLLLGYRIREPFVEFAKYVKNRYGAEPGFVTQNLPTLVGFLEECGIENPVVCSGINKIGYLMNPDQKSYEKCIAEKKIRSFAMSILASGAVPPRDAVRYLKDSVPNVHSVVFGASSKNHIADTIALIKQNFPDWE